MKKLLRIIALLLVMGLCFLAGWRVMPKIWPAIKTQVVYRVLPDLEPTPAPVVTPAPYEPEHNAVLGDPIAPADSLVYYFYKEYCPYCAAIEPIMAGLPAQLTLPDGALSTVKLVCLNKNDPAMAELIDNYYAEYSVPEDKQFVPAVVVGDRYLMPGREIIDQLMDALTAGEGLLTPVIDGSPRTN